MRSPRFSIAERYWRVPLACQVQVGRVLLLSLFSVQAHPDERLFSLIEGCGFLLMKLLVELFDRLGREERGHPRTSEELAKLLGGFGLKPCSDVFFCPVSLCNSLNVCHLFFLSYLLVFRLKKHWLVG